MYISEPNEYILWTSSDLWFKKVQKYLKMTISIGDIVMHLTYINHIDKCLRKNLENSILKRNRHKPFIMVKEKYK